MGKAFAIICLLALATLGLTKAMTAGKVILALNCGSKDEVVDSHDKVFKYQADQKYVSGESVPVDYHTNEEATSSDILYTFEKRLYMYERHTYKQMVYTLPVKRGKVTLVLKFAEMYFTQAGQRVFDIKIGSQIVRSNFDVVQKAGGRYAAHEEYIEVEVREDGVYFEGSKVKGGLSSTGNKLKLVFSKGRADNPIVQGIIVYHDSIENSPKQEFEYLRKTWDKQKELQKAMKEEEKLKEIVQIQKKKEKISIRNDQIIVEKTVPAADAHVSREKFGLVRKLLMGPLGIVGWSVAFGVALTFLYKKVFLMSSQNPKTQ